MEVKKANVLEMTPRTWGCFGLRVRRGVGTRTRVASSGRTGNKPGTRLGSGITGNRHGLSRDDLRWSGRCSQLDNIVRVRRVDVELRSSDLFSQAGQAPVRRGKSEVTTYPPGVRLAGILLVRKEMSGSSIIFSRSKEGCQCSRRSSAYYQPAPLLASSYVFNLESTQYHSQPRPNPDVDYWTFFLDTTRPSTQVQTFLSNEARCGNTS